MNISEIRLQPLDTIDIVWADCRVRVRCDNFGEREIEVSGPSVIVMEPQERFFPAGKVLVVREYRRGDY